MYTMVSTPGLSLTIRSSFTGAASAPPLRNWLRAPRLLRLRDQGRLEEDGQGTLRPTEGRRESSVRGTSSSYEPKQYQFKI